MTMNATNFTMQNGWPIMDLHLFFFLQFLEFLATGFLEKKKSWEFDLAM